MYMSHGVSNWIMWGYLDYYKNAVQLFGYDPEVALLPVSFCQDTH